MVCHNEMLGTSRQRQSFIFNLVFVARKQKYSKYTQACIKAMTDEIVSQTQNTKLEIKMSLVIILLLLLVSSIQSSPHLCARSELRNVVLGLLCPFQQELRKAKRHQTRMLVNIFYKLIHNTWKVDMELFHIFKLSRLLSEFR